MDTYGLIGFPLKHSFSAKFFAEKFHREEINAEYLNFEIEDIHEIRRVILFHQHLKGLNVTIPYKEKVLPFLHDISPEAKKIGAVNTIRVDRKPGDMYFYRLTGYNTDYIGFRDSLLPLLNPAIHRKALILGTGGASKAVAQALQDLHISWQYVSRTPGENRLTYDLLTPEVMSTHQLIVNASPVGTFPHSDVCPDIPYQLLTADHLLYDLVYNPEETLFLKKGKAQGTLIKNGREMLEIQAGAAWEIWSR
ncbi:MAG: shikimate dehydrogenase [Proteiniphilum sp.]|jgi:shikimate dehydrogenase|nr:shikimate dehydrogenase [Proteiniphilum sp.]MDD2936743.1 shikimate dehydrogenase [Proteiniphilum sp.]MDD3076413.1 shikimate dehydrogenase [Proteiniphilum sp.]MDD3778857.1 shikimate dehydrogenase [Proteiniphilum sp.]MDD4452529.1 shikimate dehydrogenase [Proteiniphilum sp.]